MSVGDGGVEEEEGGGIERRRRKMKPGEKKLDKDCCGVEEPEDAC